MPRVKLLYALMIMGIAMCLVQIWWPSFYLTGDGPCHLYNARVLHDIWSGRDAAFYSRFYNVIYAPNPNWLSSVIMGWCMYFASGVVAEKLFLTLYALTLIFGFYKLLKQVSGSSSYLITIVFLFVFHHTLAKGFYNFSLGMALYFWMVWSWLRFIERRNTINTLVFFAFTALTFFSQLLPFVFGAITCFSLLISHIATQPATKRPRIFEFVRASLEFGILIAPFAALMLWFTDQQGGADIHLRHHFYRLIELVQFKYGINVSAREELFTGIAGFTIVTMLAIAVFLRIRAKEFISKYDGFLYSFVILLIIYILFPEDFLHRAILISMRTQLFLLAIGGLIAAYTLPQKVKNAGGLVLMACFIALFFIRCSVQNVAAEAVEDYTSVAAHIKPYSVVLPLDLAPAGRDNKWYTITNRSYHFAHALDYIGCNKPLIVLDNYEAHTGYFPIAWIDKVSPYTHLSVGNGIEGMPPAADIQGYRQRSGVAIDYVVLWCYDKVYLKDSGFADLYNYVMQHYHLVYRSASGRTMLYERNAD